MHSTEPGQSRRNRMFVVALTLLALVLRVIALGHKSFWQDEVFSVLFARPENPQFWAILKTAEANMALYYLALRGWMHWFTLEAGVRTLSVIAGTLTIPAAYALARRLYNKRVALWATAFVAVNTCAVVYSQEARGYSFVVLFATLSCWAFLRCVERPSLAIFVSYALLTICAFYSHFYAVFVILAQACALFFLPRGRTRWMGFVASWAGIGLAMIPGLRVVLLSHGTNLWWLPKPGVLEIVRTITFLAAEGGKAVGAVLAVGMLIPIGTAVSGWVRSWRNFGRSEENFRQSFAPLGLLVPCLATLALSAWRPMFFHRFLIICLVPFLLLVAEGIERVKVRRKGLTLGCILLALSCVTTGFSYSKVREDWRGAARLTLGDRVHDPVMFYTKDGAAPFTYYRQRLGAPMTEAQTMRLDAPPSKEQIAEWAARYPSITVVRFPALKQDPVDIKMTDAFTNEYRLCERRALKGLSVSWFVKGDCPAEP